MKVGDLISFSYKSKKNKFIMSKVYLAIDVSKQRCLNGSSSIEVTMLHPCGRTSKHDKSFLMVIS